jgi:hypothetical protein
MKPAWPVLMAFIVPLGAIGCSYESRETTLHEPGVYKGAKDPLLASKHQQELIDRFTLVQSDR